LTKTDFIVASNHGDRTVHDMVHHGFEARMFCLILEIYCVILRMISVTSEDVAEDVIWAAARPSHVQVAEVLVLPTHQAGLDTHRGAQ
jgi:3-hydroxy acid dehydrogenase/malonic semialdehyde reductase